jgi:S-adenosyl-L-methionine hydrolase (adenosine-forming)
MSRPIIALLSDFGTRDHYVGTMKAVVLGVCPEASLVDISHDIPPQDVRAGALELGASYCFFPPATVFLVVIDPGVGSTRRAIAAAVQDYMFVAPDNGVLTCVFRRSPPTLIVELSAPTYARPTISRTFEGRDRFAPAAAWIARGTALESLGPRLTNPRLLDIPRAVTRNDGISGEVLRVDHFGNLITNVERSTFDELRRGGPLAVHINGHTIARVVETYAEVAAGELCALFGSADHLEIAVNGGSAAERLGLTRGTKVDVRRK